MAPSYSLCQPLRAPPPCPSLNFCTHPCRASPPLPAVSSHDPRPTRPLWSSTPLPSCVLYRGQWTPHRHPAVTHPSWKQWHNPSPPSWFPSGTHSAPTLPCSVLIVRTSLGLVTSQTVDTRKVHGTRPKWPSRGWGSWGRKQNALASELLSLTNALHPLPAQGRLSSEPEMGSLQPPCFGTFLSATLQSAMPGPPGPLPRKMESTGRWGDAPEPECLAPSASHAHPLAHCPVATPAGLPALGPCWDACVPCGTCPVSLCLACSPGPVWTASWSGSILIPWGRGSGLFVWAVHLLSRQHTWSGGSLLDRGRQRSSQPSPPSSPGKSLHVSAEGNLSCPKWINAKNPAL